MASNCSLQGIYKKGVKKGLKGLTAYLATGHLLDAEQSSSCNLEVGI